MRYLFLLLPLAGCGLFPAEVDPCPMPPEQHLDVWVAVPLTDATGNVISISYACRGPR